MPNGGRRRTPGLRREEVAHLAGVGTTWYTWLEQGRDVRASLDVLEALSRALRLTPAERTHLVLLGRGEEPPPCKSDERVSPTVRRLIAESRPQPGVRDRPPLGLPGLERRRGGDCSATSARCRKPARNHVWMHFMDPAGARCSPTGSAARGSLVAKFRADSARHIGDPQFDQLIATLSKSSPEFCKAWKKHEVARSGEGRKEIIHPAVGRDGVRARGLQPAGVA